MRRFVFAGASHRAYSMFFKGLEPKLGESIDFVGIYDPNRTRCEVFRREIGEGLKIYSDFDLMLDTERPDGVIVATTDNTHAEYVIRALDKGYDVYSEKPLTNTYENCFKIREAEKRSGKRVAVTFNCRFMPYFAKVKELLKSGIIGRVYSINYEYTLNRWHGGDYFKRWHKHMEISQGMLVHKSTHHFDIINWLLEDEPSKVAAIGNRVFYGNPEKAFGERCSTCSKADKCESYKSQSAKMDKALYFEAEHEDGYIRDACAYAPNTDIYDNMSVSVLYKKGTVLTYSLNLFSMREGYTMTITGEEGTLLLHNIANGYEACSDKYEIILLKRDGGVRHIIFDAAEGAHGGGDAKLLDMMFGEGEIDDPLGQYADSYAGVASAIIGIAANDSIATGRTVILDEMLEKLRD